MPMTTSALPRVIVIPRQLEEFFYGRLTSRYAGRNDVRVVVDRRLGERRDGHQIVSTGQFVERRSGERRTETPVWSLPDMPFSTS